MRIIARPLRLSIRLSIGTVCWPAGYAIALQANETAIRRRRQSGHGRHSASAFLGHFAIRSGVGTASSVVAPLVAREQLSGAQRMNPIFTINGAEYWLATHELFAIEQRMLEGQSRKPRRSARCDYGGSRFYLHRRLILETALPYRTTPEMQQGRGLRRLDRVLEVAARRRRAVAGPPIGPGAAGASAWHGIGARPCPADRAWFRTNGNRRRRDRSSIRRRRAAAR